LEVLSKVGSYFVGAQLGMFGLGFFSKQATENGLLVGTAVGFVTVAAAAIGTDIAWPWYCLIGAGFNVIVTIIASRIIDGKQHELSEYTVKGQQLKFAREGLAEKENGWYRIPGKVDRVNYWLFAFFILTLVFLWSIQYMV
jgi:SSS family solute:Na+ symporter